MTVISKAQESLFTDDPDFTPERLFAAAGLDEYDIASKSGVGGQFRDVPQAEDLVLRSPFGQWLRGEREKRGWSANKLCHLSFFASMSTVRTYEAGFCHPGKKSLSDMVDALNGAPPSPDYDRIDLEYAWRIVRSSKAVWDNRRALKRLSDQRVVLHQVVSSVPTEVYEWLKARAITLRAGRSGGMSRSIRNLIVKAYSAETGDNSIAPELNPEYGSSYASMQQRRRRSRLAGV